MTQKTQTIASQYIERLNGYLKRGRHTISSFEFKLLEKEARNLLPVDAIQGYLALGSLFALQGDAEQSIQSHEAALRLSNDRMTLSNYATSMIAIGKFSQAKKILQDLLKITGSIKPSEDPKIYSLLIGTGQYCLASKYSSLTEDDGLEALLGIINISDEEIAPYFDNIERLITKYKLAIHTNEVNTNRDEKYIFLTINAFISPRQAASINWELSQMLAETEVSISAQLHFSASFRGMIV